MRYATVGVIGAGVMGVGLAHALAQTGHQVVLVDQSDQALERARHELRDSIRAYMLLNKGSGIDSKELLSRIRFTLDLQELSAAGAQFVIENVTEKWSIKEEVYRQLDRTCPREVLFAANTSVLSITRLAALTSRAPQVLGMHFMNPVPMKPMVEVIRGYHTSSETIEGAKALLADMKKEGIVVEDSPGFVTNRVLMLTINEAIFVLHERVSTAADVDRLFRGCFGHKMGPLETADLIGLDTILLSLEGLYDSLNDPKFRPCPLLRKMVDAGLHGKKSGQGFFSYR